MIDIVASASQINILGRLGENKYRRMVFDVSEYLNTYPNASFTLMNQLPGDNAAYPVANTSLMNGSLYWAITASDLSQEGQGRCELVVMSDDVIAKSIIYLTKILPALDGSETPPSPWDSWLTRFEEILNATIAARDAAQGYAQSAQQYADQAAQYALRVYVDGNTLKIEHVNSTAANNDETND